MIFTKTNVVVTHPTVSGVEPRLFELGEVTDTEVFSPWTESLDQAMEKLRHTYVENFAAEEVWPWCCRLNLTPEGELG